jgi:hypothetical protein
MKKPILPKLLLFIFLSLVINKTSVGQVCSGNVLTNPGFENPVQTNTNVNNIVGTSFNGWSTRGGSSLNVIKVNGSGYTSGPDNASEGLQYINVIGAGDYIQQSFTLSCNSNLSFNGYFANRDELNAFYVDWMANLQIVNASDVVIASSDSMYFDNNVNQEDWYKLTGKINNVPAGTYKLRAYVGSYGHFDNAFLCIALNCTLPVKLKSFDATFTSCNVNLSWQSATENNFKDYQLQYSRDGINYTTVTLFNGKGNDSRYAFTHQPSEGKAFYRLKLEDQDGRFEYSKVISLNIDCNKSTVWVYPNPVSDLLNINVSGQRNVNAMAALYSNTGVLLYRQPVINGTNTLDVKNLSSGVYTLILNTGDKMEHYKIQVIK